MTFERCALKTNLNTVKKGPIYAVDSEEKSYSDLQRLFALIVAGVFLIILGFFLVFMSYSFEISGGGVIFIGPFPIIFGAGPNSQFLITASLIIAAIMIILIITMRRRAFHP